MTSLPEIPMQGCGWLDAHAQRAHREREERNQASQQHRTACWGSVGVGASRSVSLATGTYRTSANTKWKFLTRFGTSLPCLSQKVTIKHSSRLVLGQGRFLGRRTALERCAAIAVATLPLANCHDPLGNAGPGRGLFEDETPFVRIIGGNGRLSRHADFFKNQVGLQVVK